MSGEWYEVGAPRKGRPRRSEREQWARGYGYGYGAVVVDVNSGWDGWDWWVSNGSGAIVKEGRSVATREAAMAQADEAAAVLETKRGGS